MTRDLESRFAITVNNLRRIAAKIELAKEKAEKGNVDSAIKELEHSLELEKILIKADILNLKDAVKRSLQ